MDGVSATDGTVVVATSAASGDGKLARAVSAAFSGVVVVDDVVEVLQFSRITLTILHCTSSSSGTCSPVDGRSLSSRDVESASSLGLLGLRARPARLLRACCCCCSAGCLFLMTSTLSVLLLTSVNLLTTGAASAQQSRSVRFIIRQKTAVWVTYIVHGANRLGVELVIKRSRVQLSVSARLCNDSSKVVHTSVTKQHVAYNLVPVNGRGGSAAGKIWKVTEGLESHWFIHLWARV